MIFSMPKKQELDFKRRTESLRYRKNLTMRFSKLKFDFVLFSMRSSFFLIICLSIPKNLYFFIKLQNQFFQNKNFVTKITTETEYFLTFYPHIFPRLFFIETGVYQIFRHTRKIHEIINIFREKLRQKDRKSYEVPFQKNLAGKIFHHHLNQMNKNKKQKFRNLKKEKKKLIQQDMDTLKKTVERDLTNLNKILETNIIKQIYNIEQINDDSRKNLHYF
jgi:biopolymer transport protein ExbB/TolQ